MQFPLVTRGLWIINGPDCSDWGIFTHSSRLLRTFLANGEFQNGLRAEREFTGRFSASPGEYSADFCLVITVFLVS